MKPPLRSRLAPARFVTALGAAAGAGPEGRQRPGAAWSGREKRRLLAALRAQAGRQLPELRLLREKLPRRSEEEILRYLSRLRGRAAREAVSTRYRHCLEQQRRRRAQLPAPIEVWLELAEALAESLEEATAAAFSQVRGGLGRGALGLGCSPLPGHLWGSISPHLPSLLFFSLPQVLTVAATEPQTLSCSIPPQPPLGEPSGTPQEPPEDPPGGGGFTVSFPRLYEFLAQLCRGQGGAKGPLLPPAESAVVLALLNSLPQELQRLDLDPLQSHFRGSYSALTAPRDPPGTPPETTTETPSNPQPRTPLGGWGGVGLCPLNLFLVPLKLLARGGPSG
ncbi:SNPC2 protein, partial [Ramphastos sulfuratus]|nr:SNPC2 protein [Ramphastos sulfuratus]